MTIEEDLTRNVDAPELEDDEYIFKSKFNDMEILLAIMSERNLSEFDAKCVLASMIIEEWVSDPDIAEYLKDKSKEYIHTKGYSNNKTLKEEHTIPLEAFVVLPKEIRDEPKRLVRWLKENHRYLIFK